MSKEVYKIYLHYTQKGGPNYELKESCPLVSANKDITYYENIEHCNLSAK